MSQITPETIQIAANVGLQVLDLFLKNRGEAKSEEDLQLRAQLQELSSKMSTAKGTADFRAILEEHESRTAFEKSDEHADDDADDTEGQPI